MKYSIQVDGQLTLNENVADLGAIKAIVATHRRWTRQNGPEFDLPGLNFTQEQILIINAAQVDPIGFSVQIQL